MEIKRIVDLSITECLERIQIKWTEAKSVITHSKSQADITQSLSNISATEASEIKTLVINRLAELLLKDKSAYSACRKKSDYQTYLSAWTDGLWREEAETFIKQIEEKEKETSFFERNINSIAGLNKYLSSYPRGKYAVSARQLLNAKKRNRKIKTISISAIVVLFFTIWGWVSYKPLPNLSLQDLIDVSQYGDTILLSNYVQGTDNRTSIYIENEPTKIVADDSLGYNIYRNDAPEYYDIGPTESSDHIDLSWPKTIYLREKYIIPMNCSQNVIEKRIRIETFSEIFGIKIETKTNYIKIRQHGGGATYMYKTEWYKPKFNANGRIDIDVDNNGIRGNSYPVFLNTDGTYVNVQISDSWITVEKRDDVEGDSYNFHIRVEENRTSDKRIGIVKFSSGDKYIEYVLSQAKGYATYFEIDKDEFYVSSDEVWQDGDSSYIYGNHYSIKIDTDGIWDYKLDDDYDWIKVRKSVYNDKIEYQVRGNTGFEREANIIISTLNMGTKTISITQFGIQVE